MRCTNGECQREATKGFKQCPICRHQKREHMRKIRQSRTYYPERGPKVKMGWTNKRWKEFVQAGGLNGL